VDGFILRAPQKIRDRSADRRHLGILCSLALTILIAPSIAATAFAEVSPAFGNAAIGSKADDSPIQLAAANLPSVGSVDDYMHQDNDGPAPSAGGPPPAYQPQPYQPQPAPQQGFYPQGPSQEWNNYGYADPNAERNELIGAAVVGAVAVGLWAWQQHEAHQAQLRTPKRLHSQRRAYANSIE
jgi:hypothetical protein